MIGTEYKRYMKNGLLCNKEYDEVLWLISEWDRCWVGKFVMPLSSIYSEVRGVWGIMQDYC
jgi:hypothetical protein